MKRRIILTSIISIIMILVLMIGSTYSLFVTSNIDEELNVYRTGNLDVTYTLSEDNVVFTNKIPVSEEDVITIQPYRITINNIGNVPYKFNVVLNDTTASDKIDYQYIMTKVGKLESMSLADYTADGSNIVIKSDVVVPANDSVIIDIRVYLSENIQNTEMGKSFYAKLSIDGLAIYNDNVDIDNSILMLPSEFDKVFEYTGDVQEYTVPYSGYYLLEAWGAQGGNYSESVLGGKGAYTSGIIKLEKEEKLYVYVGGKGINLTGGYNGGGNAYYADQPSTGGGGASDIRLVGGNWNNSASLASRIMVASGGGGSGRGGGSGSNDSSSSIGYGGPGGSLVGVSGTSSLPSYGTKFSGSGGTQTSGGFQIENNIITGGFGFGGSGTAHYVGSSGGGGGYYGGGSTTRGHNGGGGGSSYISGYVGCVAIISSSEMIPKSGCTTGTADVSCSYHYSNKIFINPEMKAGNEIQPTFTGIGTQTGNSGDGYVKITFNSNGI